MRRGATEIEAEINGIKFREPGRQNAKQKQQDNNRQHRRGVRSHELAVGKKRRRAGVMFISGVVMEIFVKRRTGGEGNAEQQRRHQQTANH